MHQLAEKHINPFTDYGFKKLFGEESNKELLLDFLNELLKEEQGHIKELTYVKTEYLGTRDIDREAIFDLYCENEKGEKFIIELRKGIKTFFEFGMTNIHFFPKRKEAKRPHWNLELEAVYLIDIMGYTFNEDENDPHKFRFDSKIKYLGTDIVVSDNLNMIYLEMPKFNKTVDELESKFDKWLYVLKNLHTLDSRPEKLGEKIFEKLFETAEIAKFTIEQAKYYEDSLKSYRDMKNPIYIAEEKVENKASKKEKIEGNTKTALNLLSRGIDVEIITQITGFSKSKIEKLK